ncbi:MAG: hypothetical protein ACK456_01075 [Pseudanabaenaceae cyanobacterium]
MANNVTTAQAVGVSASLGLALAGNYAKAETGGSVRAQMNANIGGAKDMTVKARATGSADAKVTAGTIGLISGSLNSGNANVSTSVDAHIGNSVVVTTDGNIAVDASSEGVAAAQGFTLAIGGAAIGTMFTAATVDPSVIAYIGKKSTVSGADVSVKASHNMSNSGTVLGGKLVYAKAEAPSGGLVAGSGTRPVANANANVATLVGTGSTINANGSVTVKAQGSNQAQAESGSLSIGLAGFGINFPEANANGSVITQMNGSIGSGQNATIAAKAINSAKATGDAAAAGLVGVTVTEVKATASPYVATTLGDGSSVNITGGLSINSAADSNTVSRVNGIAAGLAGIGSVKANAITTPSITTAVGKNGRLKAGTIDINAEFNTTTGKKGADAYSSAAGGGLVSVQIAEANATVTPSVNSYVDSGTTLESTGVARVGATAIRTTKARSEGLSIGLVSVGLTLANATVSGDTNAEFKDNGSRPNAADISVGGLIVDATSIDTADASIKATSGGLISVAPSNDNKATAVVMSNTKGWVGANRFVLSNGDLTIRATGNPEGDARTEGVNAGGVAIGGSVSNAFIQPTVTSGVGSGSYIQQTGFGGNVSITASGTPQTQPVAGTTSDYNIKATNTSSEVLQVLNHRLATGDQVMYFNLLGQPITGLQSNRIYNVLNVNVPTTRNFTKTNVTSSGIAVASNVFKEGDQVTYSVSNGAAVGGLVSGSTYYVVGVSNIPGSATSQTLQLAATQGGEAIELDASTTTAAANHSLSGNAADPNNIAFGGVLDGATIDFGNDIIKFTGAHGLQTGDKVKYVSSGTSVSGLVDGNSYYVQRISDTEIKLSTSPSNTQVSALPSQIDQTTSPSASNTNAIHVANSFSNGDAVTYRTPVPAQTFFGRSVDVGFDGDGKPVQNTGGDNILMDANQFKVGDALVYTKDQGDDIAGLVSGQTYYVVAVADAPVPDGQTSTGAQLIKLSATAGGTAIAIDRPANGRSAYTLTPKTITGLTEGQTYYVVNRTATSFQLANTPGGAALSIATTGLSATGSHKFVREGIDFVSPNNSATQTLDKFGQLRLDISSGINGFDFLLDPSGSALTPGSNSGGGGDGVSTSNASGSGGGLISSISNSASLAFLQNVSASMNGSVLVADGNVTISTNSQLNTSGSSNNGSGGLIAFGDASTNFFINNNSVASIGNNLTGLVGGNLTVSSNLDNNTGTVRSSTKAGGLVADVNANASVGTITATQATIGSNGNIVVGGTARLSTNSSFTGESRASGDAVGLGGVGTANSSNSVNGNNSAAIGNNTILNSGRLEMSSVTDNTNLLAKADSFGAGFYGEAKSGANMSFNVPVSTVIGNGAQVTGLAGVDLRSNINGASATSDAYSRAVGFIAYSEANSSNNSTISSNVTTGGGSVVYAGPDSSGRALYVESTNSSGGSVNRNASKAGLFAFSGGGSSGGVSSPSGTNWGSKVVFLGTTAELLVDTSGNVTRQTGLSASSGATDINVNNIASPGTISAQFVGPVSDSSPTWEKSGGLQKVRIINSSNKNLIINNIDGSTASAPAVSLSGISKSINSVGGAQTPTMEISNLGSGNLQLNGSINNGSGVVSVRNAGGNITSNGGSITSNGLNISADQGSVGTLTNRVVANLINASNPLTPVTFNPIQIKGTGTNGSIFLGANSFYTGQQVTYTASGGNAIGALISGQTYFVIKSDDGNSVRLAVRDSNNQLVSMDLTVGPGVAATHAITPVDLGVGITAGNNIFATLNGAAGATTNVVKLVQAGNDINLNLASGNATTFDFRNNFSGVDKAGLTAGGSLTINGGSNVNILGLVSMQGADINTNWIDVTTSGSVLLGSYETNLNIKNVTSTGSDVTLFSFYSILNGLSLNTANVTANNVNLAAFATIGGNGQFLNVNSRLNGIGMINASAGNGIYISETVGNMHIGRVISALSVTLPTVPLTTYLPSNSGLINPKEVILRAADGAIIANVNDGTSNVVGSPVSLIARDGSGGVLVNVP